MLLECLVCSSCTVHPLLLGEFLDPILLESLVCNLYTVHPLSLGEFLLPLLFQRDFVSCAHRSFATFLLEPSAHFHLECLLCASLTLPSFGATLSLPVQSEHLLEHHWSLLSILQSSRSLFLFGHLCHFILGISSETLLHWFLFIHTPACWRPFSVWTPLPLYSGHLFRDTTSLVSLYPYSSLLELSFQMCFLDLPTCFGCLLRVTTLLFLFILAPAYWSYLFGHISSFCPLAQALLVWFFVRAFRVIFSAFVVRPKTDLFCLLRIRHHLSSFPFLIGTCFDTANDIAFAFRE